MHELVADAEGDEMERLVKAAASGEIGIAEAARGALKIIR
jgi:hypothetical protein